MNEFIEVPCNKSSLVRRKLVYGIGINDALYVVQPTKDNKQQVCPYYKIWRAMLQRCYSEKYHNNKPTYKDCFVCNDWLTFSIFKSWVETQEWEGKELDKDLLVRGNKCYSPETCIFVSQAINILLNNKLDNRGKFAIGVCFNITQNKYVARCSVDGKSHYLGIFITEEEASQTYLQYKKEVIIATANQQTDIKLKEALLRIAQEEYLL